MILKEWGFATYIEQINREMVLRYLDKQAISRSSNASNKDRKNLLAMWNWSQDILGITFNPVLKIKKLPHERASQYTPPKEDILKILRIATKKERVFLDSYLQTGARRSEIFRWTWVNDINFQKREYRLGTRKTQDGSMEYEWFPMSDKLYESLKWQWENRKFKENPFVFICEQPGLQYGKPYKARRRFLKGLCTRAGVKQFGFQGLRRHVASLLAETHNISSKTIQRILRHKNLNTTEKYIQNINKDLKNTLNLLSETYKEIPQYDTPNKKEDNDDDR
jgi:integrase